ncbi:MAG TPA: cache domain-containing protein, partial [Spirochaetia bacterium]|nr:cache domain-containing protein [Spirochaetia bacterium]
MNRTTVERIILVAVLIVLYAVGIFFIRRDYTEDISGTHRNALVTMGHEYAAVIQGFSNLSGIFFEEEIAIDPVTSIMSSAWHTSTGQERAGYRALLYKNLTPLYEKLGLYRFSQLHFHFPDTTSFLRFNRPQRFGDRLDTQRESVRIVNLEKRAVSGFEADRVSGTYRFVHPLFHHGEHV